MRKLTINTFVLFALLGTSLAHGQTYQRPPSFQHIIVIVQENRTPDSLFGSNPSQAHACGNEDPFEQGVDIDNGGPSNFSGAPSEICSAQLPDLSTGGGNHTHKPNWLDQCDYMNGACKMDGACSPNSVPACSNNPASYPPYTFVTRYGNTGVQPYFDIATNYGFANYMFQTSQGPSFPAHQFIFSGTSAPIYPGDLNDYYQYFVAENPSSNTSSGCPAPGPYPVWIDPSGAEHAAPQGTIMCYDHNTLFTYQDSNNVIHDRGVSWKYYVQTMGSIWDAPEANPQTCYFAPSGTGQCTSSEFTSHVVLPLVNNYSSAPILDDILGCNLAAVSIVTPDEAWSDHPGSFDMSLGPSWVADIIDAVGNSSCTSGNWGDTAIFVTWDDWGGFYDHVQPPQLYLGTGSLGNWNCSNFFSNNFGCGYVFGFRVPLLVISQYTTSNTISGPATYPVQYPPPTEWTHDFGSIQAFIENNFSVQGLGPITNGAQVNGQPVSYADQNSLDSVYQGQPVVPLWEFFLGSPRLFTNINPQNSAYTASYFQNYYDVNTHPIAPDEGADDE